MLGTRYEEYLNFTDNIPFILSRDIKRSTDIYSTDVNWHDNIEIQLCTQGEGFVLLDSKHISFNKGEIAIANSNVMHYTGTHNNLNYDCLILDSEFCRQANIYPDKTFFDEHFESEYILKIWGDIKKTYLSDDPCRVAKLRQLALCLLIELCENHTKSNSKHDNSNQSHQTVKNAIRYIRKNYQAKISLDDIAKNVYTNKYVLTRIFKEFTGQTIVGYINGFRCRQAQLLISEGSSVNEAARLCGFSNMSFFTKTFKKYASRLPSDYKHI